MWKKIVGIYLAISGALTTYVIGSDLSSFTKHGWDITIIAWLVTAPVALICHIYYMVKTLITGAK